MRILVISNLYPPDVVGGYELLCSHAVDVLRRRGHEVTVLTSTPRRVSVVEPQPGVLRHLELADLWNPHVLSRLNEPALSIQRARAHWIDAHNTQTLVSLLETMSPDVVYLWNLVGLGGLSLAYAVQSLGYPWVWHLMDCVPRMLCSWLDRPLPGLVGEFNRVMQGRYIAVSNGVADEILAAGITFNGPLTLLPVWITGDVSLPLQRRFHRRGEPLRLVFASALTRAKGIDIAIETARLLKEEHGIPFTLDLYGAAIEGRVEERITSARVSDRVTVRGFTPQAELIRSYLDYDLFLFPTHTREPCAAAPLEAATQGCVPLFTDDCGNAEWLVDGVHCLKAPRDAEAFAARIASVARGEVDLEGIGRRAAATTRRDFHVDHVVAEAERILGEALAEGRRPPLHDPASLLTLSRYADNLVRVLVPAAASWKPSRRAQIHTG